MIKPGVYRHYKGKDYLVVGLAHHSETREPLVVYRCLNDDYSLWVRPELMFRETVIIDGKVIPRFAFLHEA